MVFVKGDPNINRNGRPKGKTIKERVRDYLEENPQSMEDFVKHFIEKNRDLAWQMLEGRPSQQVEANIQGEVKIEISEKIAKKYDTNSDTESDS